MQTREKRLNFYRLRVAWMSLLGWAAVSPFSSQAGDYRLGFALGFGGAGVTQEKTVSNVLTTVSRSEGPGTLSFWVERLMSDRFALSLEHSRGFRLGPFSAGVGLTGVGARWFFWGSAPSVPDAAAQSGQNTVVLVKALQPFIGFGTGVAAGRISRSDDLVPEISGSGVYVSGRLGLDYQWAPGIGIRPEIIYSTTFTSADYYPATVNYFSAQVGVFFLF